MNPSAALPLLVLLAYGAAFAFSAFGVDLLVFDDHPGQLSRLWHVVTFGPAPWAWNPGWWAGYPEMQFYPPLFSYLGALMPALSAGMITPPAAYQTLLWLTYLAPGVTVFALLARLLGSGWAALPGGFLALTLSGDIASGVEGGVHVGMAPARLGWSLLPLLLLALLPWLEGRRRLPWLAAPLLAAITLLHPAHLPAAVAVTALAAVLAGDDRGLRLRAVATTLGLAAALTAFWTAPLLARLAHTRALAWREVTVDSLLAVPLAHPLLGALAVLALAAWLTRTAAVRVVAVWPWAMLLMVAVDARVIEPLGARWLPADRVLDSMWLAFILAAAVGLEAITWRLKLRGAAGAVTMVAALALAGAWHHTLELWPRPGAWPAYAATERGLRLGELWKALAAAPPGRVLFVRSGVPLVHGADWWRPHTHITALTPITAGRDIINGTFTHPSPIAALVYRGTAGPGAITTLVEQLDGRSLFGRRLTDLDAATFNPYADRLDVSVAVALDEDTGRLPMLEHNAQFTPRPPIGPFRLYVRTAARPPLARATSPTQWTQPPRAPGWTPTGIAYYPLWTAHQGSTPLATRRGDMADLEVMAVHARAPIELRYTPGLIEYTGVAITAAAIIAWLLAGWHSRRTTQRKEKDGWDDVDSRRGPR
ncbi:MAG: hypothetical protein WED01_13805 [Candidatus Rokuibacteriota bacterium]